MNAVAISTCPELMSVVSVACDVLEQAGFPCTTYPADGVGGRSMEEAIRAGAFVGVLDFALTELAAEQQRLPGGAGRDRLTAAALIGIPQVIVPGGLQHLSDVRLADSLAKEVAEKACAARGPTLILLPEQYTTEAVMGTFTESLQMWVYGVEVRTVPLAIDDPEFAIVAAQALLALLNPHS